MKQPKNVLVFALCVGLLLGLASCNSSSESFRIGVKNFTEQSILAQMAATLLRQEGIAVAPLTDCGDTFECHRLLRTGQLDLMVEYTGTGLFFLGQPIGQRAASLDEVRGMYEPEGLAWLGPLGFDNGYSLLMTPERSSALGATTISDLSKVDGGIRIGCPSSYLRRPRDGLGALFERHGLRRAASPVVMDDIDERIQALLDGRVDVIVTYDTDGATADLNLRELKDSLSFFPPYEAAFVARQEALDANPAVKTVLAKLDGKLSVETIQRLNYSVEVEGRNPAIAARTFLVEGGLLPEDSAVAKSRAEVIVAVHAQDDLAPLDSQVLRVARKGFPGRPVVLQAYEDPARQVASGNARLALQGAERFFSQGKGDVPQRERLLEAATVMGTRMVHIVRRERDQARALDGRIGAPPAQSGAGKIADALLGDGVKPAQRNNRATLLEALKQGKLDGVITVVTVGDESLRQAMTGGTLFLAPLKGWLTPARALKHPFLRPTRLPAQTYPGQAEAIETVGVQVVLAGPTRLKQDIAAGGPASALLNTGVPLTDTERNLLTEATGIPDAPDSALPSAWSTPTKAEDDSWIADLRKTLLNLLAIFFTVWLGRLWLRNT